MSARGRQGRGRGLLWPLVTVLVLAGWVPTLCNAEGADERGYFFLSARPTEEGKRRLDRHKEEDREQERLRPEYYTTRIHGPFRTRIEARRALRACKNEDPEDTYYTRIYRL